MKIPELNDKNIILYAAKHYDNPCCTEIEEFFQDLAIATLIKKLISKYESNGTLKDRLVVNHFISFMNVFENLPAIRILFYKMDDKFHPYLKSLLIFSDRCPEELYLNSNKYLRDIKYNEQFLTFLEKSYVKSLHR